MGYVMTMCSMLMISVKFVTNDFWEHIPDPDFPKPVRSS